MCTKFGVNVTGGYFEEAKLAMSQYQNDDFDTIPA